MVPVMKPELNAGKNQQNWYVVNCFIHVHVTITRVSYPDTDLDPNFKKVLVRGAAPNFFTRF
jgi:hypothetical protein